MKNKVQKITGNRLSLEHLGWYSTALFLTAYFMISVGILEPNSLTYQALNLTGAIGYVYYAHRKGVYPSVFANSVWALVGLVTIAGILL